jgi:hypothetical protein
MSASNLQAAGRIIVAHAFLMILLPGLGLRMAT